MDLEALQQQCLDCRKCPLCETRQHVVFGMGVPDAEVLFVGEGPGASEDAEGLPFVGRSGKLLDSYLMAVGLDRQTNIYIANIVKCRPPQNRDPLPEETAACKPWLREQFRLLRPKIVVCLGRVAAQQMIDPGFSVTREHGVFIEKGGVLFMATLHPAALLRAPANKAQVFGDFLALRDKINEICTHTTL
ncbi:MAG: uracil-DNA glycosylase [Gemmiger sp.]|nr:uracil-DNA glycosylase [Gemmiger sp.]